MKKSRSQKWAHRELSNPHLVIVSNVSASTSTYYRVRFMLYSCADSMHDPAEESFVALRIRLADGVDLMGYRRPYCDVTHARQERRPSILHIMLRLTRETYLDQHITHCNLLFLFSQNFEP